MKSRPFLGQERSLSCVFLSLEEFGVTLLALSPLGSPCWWLDPQWEAAWVARGKSAHGGGT